METAGSDVFPWDEFETELLPLCESKAEEFHLLGYEGVKPQEILQCVRAMMKGRGALHQVVAAILGLTVGQFMNYMTISAYKGQLDD